MKNENIRIVEIRDRATCIVAMAIKMIPNMQERFLFCQIGYRSLSNPCILLVSLEAPWCSARCSDEWKGIGRTFPIAHKWIEENFDSIEPCQVIDVEFILGEVDKPCQSCEAEQIEELLNLPKDEP
jgi:hypothetical protein